MAIVIYLQITLLAFGLMIASVAHADCYSMKNSDNKNVCLAKAKNQSSYCYSVLDSDIKNNCLAVVKEQRSYCYSIRSNDLKNQCLALVEK